MTKYPTLIAKPQKLHTWALIQSMMGSLLAFQESIGIASLTLGISHVEVSGHIWISLSWFEYHSTGEIHHQLRCAILAQGFPLHISPGVVTKRLTQKKHKTPQKRSKTQPILSDSNIIIFGSSSLWFCCSEFLRLGSHDHATMPILI